MNRVRLTPGWTDGGDSVLIHDGLSADGLQGDNDVFNLRHNDRLVDVGGAEAMMPNGASSCAGGGGVRV